MLPSISSSSFAVFHFALQQTRARHQDGIVHFLAQLKGLRGLDAGIVQIADVKVEQPAVFQHAADSMMVIMVAIDFFRQIQIGEGAAAQLFMLPQLAVLLSARQAGVLGPCRRSLSASICLPIWTATSLCTYAMLVSVRARFLCCGLRLVKMLNGAGKELQRFLIMSLAAHHAAMGGIYVAQRDVVVAVAQRRFRLVQNARCFAILAFLKEQPALQDAHDRGHLGKTQRLGQFASDSGALQRFIILALLAMAARVPEVRDRHQLLVFNLLLHGKHHVKLTQALRQDGRAEARADLPPF